MCTQLAQPFLVSELVRFVATGHGGIQRGVGLSFALAAVSIASSIFLTASLYTNRLLGVSIRSGDEGNTANGQPLNEYMQAGQIIGEEISIPAGKFAF